MPSVRISSNSRNIHKMEWAGAPNIDKNGQIERSINISEEAYQAIERAVALGGGPEGTVFLKDGTKFQWFLDR